jgi:hypothetical protein
LIIENICDRTRYNQVKQGKCHVSLVSKELLQDLVKVRILLRHWKQNADYQNKNHLHGYEEDDKAEPEDHKLTLTVEISVSPSHLFDSLFNDEFKVAKTYFEDIAIHCKSCDSSQNEYIKGY